MHDSHNQEEKALIYKTEEQVGGFNINAQLGIRTLSTSPHEKLLPDGSQYIQSSLSLLCSDLCSKCSEYNHKFLTYSSSYQIKFKSTLAHLLWLNNSATKAPLHSATHILMWSKEEEVLGYTYMKWPIQQFGHNEYTVPLFFFIILCNIIL